MGTSAPKPAKKWTVTGHAETPDFDENGKATTTHTVAFTSHPSGIQSSVTLPDSHFSATNIAAQINHKHNELEQVNGMTSENQPPAEAA